MTAVELDIDEAMRLLGASGGSHELRRQVTAAQGLLGRVSPKYVFRMYPLERTGEGFSLMGSGVTLAGGSAERMLSDCGSAALLACTLGVGFDALLRREQVSDMANAVILDACGSALTEAGCDEAEKEIAALCPGMYLTDRFSPGYGDLPLTLQPDILSALDAGRRLGLCVSDSLLMNPVKSVTAVIGIAQRPQMAKIRGCGYCRMRENCELRKGGRSCA